VLLALTTNAAAQACADSDPIDVTVSSGSDAAGSELCRPNGSRCPIMVDVRAQSEWDAGHVSCATRIPVQDDASRTGEVLTLAGGDSSHPVVVYCYSGARAGRAVTVLTNAGFTDVTNGGGFVSPAGNDAILEEMCTCSTPCPAPPPASTTYSSCAALLATEGDATCSTIADVGSRHCQLSCGTCSSELESAGGGGVDPSPSDGAADPDTSEAGPAGGDDGDTAPAVGLDTRVTTGASGATTSTPLIPLTCVIMAGILTVVEMLML
jgi:phage shock protein E